MMNKLVVELVVNSENPYAVARFLADWYEPGPGHQTTDGIDFEVVTVNVIDEGRVEGG